MHNSSDIPNMKDRTAEEEVGTSQARHSYHTLLKPFPEFNGVPPNKAVGTDVVCVEGFKAISDICNDRRPGTTANKTRYFMQMPGVIVVGILLNPFFGLLSFLTQLLAKRAKQTHKRRQWRRVATRLYFTGVIITVGIWAAVLAYGCGLYYRNVERTQAETGNGNKKETTNIPLKVLTSQNQVMVSPYSLTEREAETTAATTTHSTEPPILLHNKKTSYEQFQLELSPFASDQRVAGIQDKDSGVGPFPFRK